MSPFDTVIHEITDEDGMLKYINVKPAINVESVGSGDSGAIVLAIDTSGQNTKRHHMVGPSAHVHLDHNPSPCNFFNLMMGDEFRSVIWQECTNMRAEMEGAVRKGDWYRKRI